MLLQPKEVAHLLPDVLEEPILLTVQVIEHDVDQDVAGRTSTDERRDVLHSCALPTEWIDEDEGRITAEAALNLGRVIAELAPEGARCYRSIPLGEVLLQLRECLSLLFDEQGSDLDHMTALLPCRGGGLERTEPDRNRSVREIRLTLIPGAGERVHIPELRSSSLAAGGSELVAPRNEVLVEDAVLEVALLAPLVLRGDDQARSI